MYTPLNDTIQFLEKCDTAISDEMIGETNNLC